MGSLFLLCLMGFDEALMFLELTSTCFIFIVTIQEFAQTALDALKKGEAREGRWRRCRTFSFLF